MNYYTKDGKKWSIEKGDWENQQALEKHEQQIRKIKQRIAITLLIIVIVIIIAAIFFLLNLD